MWIAIFGFVFLFLVCYFLLLKKRGKLPKSGSNVVITGASSGIGASLAKVYAKSDCDNLILTGRNKDRLEKVKIACEIQDSKCTIIVADLSNPSDVQRLCKEVLSIAPTIHRLVLNAGISQHSLFEDTDPSLLRRMFQVNFFAAAELTRGLLPALKSASGQILVVSSVQGFLSSATNTIYCSSKHALGSFFDCLRGELRPHNVGISIIYPGPVDTPILGNLEGPQNQTVGFKVPKSSLMSSQEAAERIVHAGEMGWNHTTFQAYLFSSLHLIRFFLPRVVDGLLDHFYLTMPAETSSSKEAGRNAETASSSVNHVQEKREPIIAQAKREPSMHSEKKKYEKFGHIDQLGAGAIIDWTYRKPRDFLDGLFGPDRTQTETWAMLICFYISPFLLIGCNFLYGWDWGIFQMLTAMFQIGDMLAGIVIFSSNAGKRWWFRPRRRNAFEVLRWVPIFTLHPFLMWMFFGLPLNHSILCYLFVFVGSVAVCVVPLYHHRLFEFCLFAFVVLADLYYINPALPTGMEWFALLYHFKYICCWPLREEPYRPEKKSSKID